VLDYLPEIVEDELLYSVLARWRLGTGMPSSAGFMREVFGIRTAIASVHLPARLSALAERLPIHARMDATRLLERHTLFPYYAAYQPADIREAGRLDMLEGHLNASHIRLGVAAYRIKPPANLRFCPTCLEDDMARLGVGAWRRAHQLPGSLVCVRHGTLLQESLVGPRSHERHAAIPASWDVCVRSEKDPISGDQRVLLERLAASEAGLLAEIPAPTDPSAWKLHYRDRLRRVGLMRSTEKVDLVTLETEIRSFYEPILTLLPEPCGRLGEGGWVTAMVREHRKSAHPLFHVMLGLFLDSRRPVADPFGPGPWPCLNPLAEHMGTPMIPNMRQYRNRGTVIGVFECSCGHSYTRCLRPDGSLDKPRLRNAGPLFEPALRTLVSSGRSLRSISAALSMDPKTVVAAGRRLGIEMPWALRTKGSSVISTAGRRQTPSVVRAPVAGKRSPARDWSAVDSAMTTAFLQARRDMECETPNARVTLTALESRAGYRGYLAKRRGKLPSTEAVVSTLVETSDQFRRRRIRRALDRLPLETAPWQVLRSAGVRSDAVSLVEQERALHPKRSDSIVGAVTGRSKEL